MAWNHAARQVVADVARVGQIVHQTLVDECSARFMQMQKYESIRRNHVRTRMDELIAKLFSLRWRDFPHKIPHIVLRPITQVIHFLLRHAHRLMRQA